MELQNCINRTVPTPRIVFPLLKEIQLSSLCLDDYNRNAIFVVEEVSIKFILSRMRAGYPIATLRLMNYINEEAGVDLEVLAEAKCLKVAYECIGVDEDYEFII